MSEALQALCAALQAQGTAERADWDRQYHKSDLDHWGVKQPDLDKCVRAQAKLLSREEILTLAEALWQPPVWDCRIAAGKLLALPRVKASDALWKYLTRHLPEMTGWAVMDIHAKAAGKCLLADPGLLDEVEEWTREPSFWMRRAALVLTLPFAARGRDPERILGWAAGYVSDREWFIQKAIGWWLRTLSKHNPARVEEFLDAHGDQLMAVARREATKYLA
ncbi:DNA alkylation repair protein [Aestuariispira insulae]|uniref:DNA alkylation repair enzyme n=1 Tax=Aestuariispira insulae TaxID=1461337 RepID=A0A3D9HLQ3_9PROT|nr:DNA alkylation repair protein [Aestuariispira insulae]RED49826.1 DNA alkylation repair enzyme [Aestuariispira insulae]